MDKTGTKLEAYPRKLLVQNAITCGVLWEQIRLFFHRS